MSTDKQRLHNELQAIRNNLQSAVDWFEANEHLLRCNINYNDLPAMIGAIDYELRKAKENKHGIPSLPN